MPDPLAPSSAQVLRPYFTAMLQASTELANIFDEAIKLTATYGNGKIHLEHVFYVFLAGGQNTAKDLLLSVGIDLTGFNANLIPYLRSLPKVPPEPLSVSSNVHDALSGSTDQARQTNHLQVEIVHFLLSAVKVTPENPLWHLHNITYEKLIQNYTQSTDAY